MRQLSGSLLTFSILLFLLTNCKVSQQTTAPPPPDQDTVRLALDSIPPEKETFLITQAGDTLDTLFQEVDISIDRLLPDTVTIMAVGDIMMGTQFPNKSYLPLNNGEYLWDDTRDLLASADITFGNLEGTLLDGEGDPKECNNPDACYLFKMPTRLATNLVDCGFDLLSVANNHANDFGPVGRKVTWKTLDSLGLTSAGSTEHPYTIAEIGNLKVGFVAFAPNKGTLTFYNAEYARSIVTMLDSLSDLVIISIHGGSEGAKNMHVTRAREFYFGEDRGNIYEFSHAMIDAGADLVLGHGPHVVRAIEVYKNRLIAYSLGNFLTYGRFNLKGANGEAPLLEIQTKPNGEFIGGQIHSFYQSYSRGPLKDERKQVMKNIQKLSREDFPENEILIDDEGRIIYIQN